MLQCFKCSIDSYQMTCLCIALLLKFQILFCPFCPAPFCPVMSSFDEGYQIIQWPDEGYQIFVKLSTGKTITLTVMPDDLILNVQYMIKAKTNIPTMYQRLVFNGMYLENCMTVDNYNIQKESTLHMFLAIAGGGKQGLVKQTLGKKKTTTKPEE